MYLCLLRILLKGYLILGWWKYPKRKPLGKACLYALLSVSNKMSVWFLLQLYSTKASNQQMCCLINNSWFDLNVTRSPLVRFIKVAVFLLSITASSWRIIFIYTSIGTTVIDSSTKRALADLPATHDTVNWQSTAVLGAVSIVRRVINNCRHSISSPAWLCTCFCCSQPKSRSFAHSIGLDRWTQWCQHSWTFRNWHG